MELTNAITVDLEEWFHVLYYESHVTRDRWTEYPSRIEATTERTLRLFDRAGVKATFFVLGWIAERYPSVVREISSCGHEVASHSHWHRLVHTMTRAEFEADLAESMRAVSAASGQAVRGYRAPSFSLRPDTEWVFDVLAKAGITFDSSILPMNRYYGGIPDASRVPHWIRVDGREALREFPVSTCRVLGRNCAFAGGGYLRMFPAWIVERAIAQRNAEGCPVCVYFHPWELDPVRPHLRMRFADRVRGRFSHEVLRSGMEGKLERLLSRFSFAPMGDVLSAGLRDQAIA